MASAFHKFTVGKNSAFCRAVLVRRMRASAASSSGCSRERLATGNTVSNAIMTHTSVSFWRASLLPHRSSPPYQIAGRFRR
jgi:hypothetical protein